MGYFSNGSEGMDYEAKYCARCIHNQEEASCAVLLAHQLYNYDECNKPESILHILIPRDDRGYNEKCAMFIEAGK